MKKYYLCNKKNILQGFTLVEILVVLGLFSFIMTLATVSLVTTQSVSIKLQDTQSMMDNMNLSVESIARDIRYGSTFHCSSIVEDNTFLDRKNCKLSESGGRVLFLKPFGASSDNDRDAYYATSTVNGNVIFKDEYRNGATTTYQVTANEVDIKSLVFYVTGASSTPPVDFVGDTSIYDYDQPLVTIIISGETRSLNLTKHASSTKFILETSVSSRTLDN